jgi:uncharacterized phage-like protein YoqJ
MIFPKEKSCCFTGHRPDKLTQSEESLRPLLKSAVSDALEMGITTFITGMAKGFDILAAEEVLAMRAENPTIHLVCALPYPTFRNGRSFEEKKRYDLILSAADFTQVVSKEYSIFCYQKRNIWMVDSSCRVIAAYNGTKGGTKNTIDYALSKGLEVVNILGI